MDEQLQTNSVNGQPPRKSKLWKFFFGLVAIVVVSFAILFGIGAIRNWMGEYQVQKLADTLAQAEKDEYTREMMDTYGGKTPQETLKMYISAVEKKDYVLASKYFTFGKQQKELDSWKGATKENIDTYISILKQGLTAEGSYSTTKKEFMIDGPVVFDFFVYPNGIWKLSEI